MVSEPTDANLPNLASVVDDAAVNWAAVVLLAAIAEGELTALLGEMTDDQRLFARSLAASVARQRCVSDAVHRFERAVPHPVAACEPLLAELDATTAELALTGFDLAASLRTTAVDGRETVSSLVSAALAAIACTTASSAIAADLEASGGDADGPIR
jgi:hypothetical protein